MHQEYGKDQRVLMRGRVDGIGDGSESDGDRESGDNEKEAAAKDGASTAVEGLIVCGYCDGSYTVRIEACLRPSSKGKTKQAVAALLDMLYPVGDMDGGDGDDKPENSSGAEAEWVIVEGVPSAALADAREQQQQGGRGTCPASGRPAGGAGGRPP